MNSFLLIVILAICGGSYYEYSVINQAKLEDEQQIADLQTKVNKLKALSTELAKGRTDLPPDFAELQGNTPGAPGQAPTNQAQPEANATISQPAPQPAPAAVPSAAPSAPTASANDLGTIVTIDARTFQNCQLLKVEADGITFKHAEGITKVLFPLLPPDVQKRFGFDPHQPLLTPDQVTQQEDVRRAAAN
jgi:hypothetical protein